MTTMTAPPPRHRRTTRCAPEARRAHSTGTFIDRSYLHTLRTPDALVMAIALPTILMLMFTFVFGGAIDPTGGYVDYVVPGIILLCAGFGAASIAVDVASDMATGHHRPVPHHAAARRRPSSRGTSSSTWCATSSTTAIVIGVALAVGFRPTRRPARVGRAGVRLVAGYILAITYLFAAIGLASSSPEAACGYGFILLFVPYLSSAFVPVETMPEWLQLDRREPAAHADHRDHPRPADGHRDRRQRLARGRLDRC